MQVGKSSLHVAQDKSLGTTLSPSSARKSHVLCLSSTSRSGFRQPLYWFTALCWLSGQAPGSARCEAQRVPSAHPVFHRGPRGLLVMLGGQEHLIPFQGCVGLCQADRCSWLGKPGTPGDCSFSQEKRLQAYLCLHTCEQAFSQDWSLEVEFWGLYKGV